MASSSLPAANHKLRTAILPCKKPRFCQPLKIKAQSYRDHHEGRSSDIIDANLHLLRVRIEEAKNKERLERCFVAEQGWNYTAMESFEIRRININNKKINNHEEFLQLVGMVAATFGFTVLSCSFCLCIASLLFHFNQ